MSNINILGATGMLGSMVAKTIPDAEVISRDEFNAENPTYHWYGEGDWIINCIGLIKPYCDNVASAIVVNSLFPHTLPPKTIQIATDCVYSGAKGSYVETDPHDALDVYGKTKSLGETKYIKNLRCSIIGPEIDNHLSLWDWFLGQTVSVNGFANHLWNGITTYHFAKIAEGVIREGIELPNVQHIVPADKVTKAELLRLIATATNHDITVIDAVADQAVDRTLATLDKKMNDKLWKAAGYDKPPTIEQMINELGALK